MPRPRTILALGNFHSERRKRFEAFAKETLFELVVYEGLDAAIKWLEAHEPRVVLFDTIVAKAHTLCLRVRAKKTLASVPIIGLARVITDDAMSDLFAAGADDVVPIAARDPLLHRLRAVPMEQSFHPPPDRGCALVADGNHDRCAVIGRTLMSAGYEVRFAIDRRSLDHYALLPETKLVVANAALGVPSEMIACARKAGGVDAVWLITDTGRDVATGAEPIPDAERALTVSAHLPPESLLFLSNELLSPLTTSKRMTPRLLHGTVVSFREAGSEEDDLGFTYNVSTHGVFVRTLAAPSCKTVWIDLRPPGSQRAVRLQGEIAWRRPFNPGKFAITPPGFGVQIACGLGDSVERWTAAVDKLVSTAHKRPRLDELLEETLRDSMVNPIEPPPLPNKPAEPPHPSPPAPRSKPPAPKPRPASAPPPKEVVAPPRSPPPPLPLIYPDDLTDKGGSPAAVSEGEREMATVGKAPRPAARSRRLLVMSAVGALLCASAALAVFVVLPWIAKSDSHASVPAAPQAPAAPPARSTASALQASATAPSSVTAAASATAPSSVTAAASATAATTTPGASASASASASPKQDTGPDGTDLLTNEGYLVVWSGAEADVYCTGIKLGSTNAKNKSRCGQKFVRLGEGTPPRWISEGTTVNIACRSVTQLTLEPGR